MRNRAKCKLCQSILESFHRTDYVACSCGEIAIDGGDFQYLVYAKNYSNFLRIDDEGNEIIIKVRDPSEMAGLPKAAALSYEDLVNMLEEQCNKIVDLPIDAALSSVNHTDFASLMMLLVGIFRSKKE